MQPCPSFHVLVEAVQMYKIQSGFVLNGTLPYQCKMICVKKIDRGFCLQPFAHLRHDSAEVGSLDWKPNQRRHLRIASSFVSIHNTYAVLCQPTLLTLAALCSPCAVRSPICSHDHLERLNCYISTGTYTSVYTSITMAFFGFRKYPTPVLKPMYPFLIGGAVTFYLVASAQKAMLQGEQQTFPYIPRLRWI